MTTIEVSAAITQVDSRGREQSSIIVTVDYDKQNNTVEGVKKIEAINHLLNISTDVTHVFMEHMDNGIEQLIERTDWRELSRKGEG